MRSVTVVRGFDFALVFLTNRPLIAERTRVVYLFFTTLSL